uniref:Uncharacterized protein n=1 Tax=Panagrolaimus davidi TaxID=227884 RepID=A0A914PJK0_9BILA
MSNQITSIAAIPRDPNDILDVIRCHIVAFAAASGRPDDQIIGENLIPTFEAIHPGFLEACLQESNFESIEELMTESCKKLVSKNVIMKIDTADFCYPVVKPVLLELSAFNHRMVSVYKVIFQQSKDVQIPFEFRKVLKWYKYLYQQNLTVAQFAKEFNLDPKIFKNYIEVIQKSEFFFIHQYHPLQIQVYGPIRNAMAKSLTYKS